MPDPKRPKNRDHAHYAKRNSATSVGVDLVMPSVCVAMTMKNPVDDELMKLPQQRLENRRNAPLSRTTWCR